MGDIFLFRGVDFELGYSDYIASNDNTSISDKLNHKKYSHSNTEFSYRIINHWEKNNLLTTKRENDKGWRKYSIMDNVWLYIIKEMRSFGISLEMIAKVKKSITVTNKGKITFPMLEYYVSLALTNKRVFLLIFENGQAGAVIEKEYQANREYSSNNNHLMLNLNRIMSKVFPDLVLESKNKDYSEPTLSERKAIQLLRLHSVSKAIVIGSDMQKQILPVKSIADSEHLVQVIFKRKYRQMEFTLGKGNVYLLLNEFLDWEENPSDMMT